MVSKPDGMIETTHLQMIMDDNIKENWIKLGMAYNFLYDRVEIDDRAGEIICDAFGPRTTKENYFGYDYD